METINEIRSVVCLESFNLIRQGEMRGAGQKEQCAEVYHGSDEKMGQAEKFIKGVK